MPNRTPEFSANMTRSLVNLGCVLFHRTRTPDGSIHYPWMSDNCLDVFGFPLQEISVNSRGALNAIHWADRDRQIDAIQQSAICLSPCQEAFRIITAEGETRWLQGSATPSRLPDGTILWEGSWIDVTTWMRAEHQFQTVMDHAEDCILTLDSNTGIEWTNAATERLFGWSQEQLRGQPLSRLVDDSTIPPMAETDSGFSPLPHRVDARHQGGTHFPFEMTVSEVRTDGKLSLIVIGRDITQRCLTEAMLEETERRLHSMANNLPGIMFQRVMDEYGLISFTYMSDGVEEILGISAHDILDTPSKLTDFILPEDQSRLRAELQISAATLDPMDEDMRVKGRDGRLHWLSGQSRPRRRGHDIVWDGVILDVTDEVEERRKAEQAIRESEERFRLGFAAASVGIVVTSLDGLILQFNPAFQRMSTLPNDQLLGRSISTFIDRNHLPDRDHLPEPGQSLAFDYQPHLPDGRERRWRVTEAQFSTHAGGRQSLLFLIDDITDIVRAVEERHQLELALNEGQKLEALGRLAGGVAHELNNMLGPILIGAEMLLRTGKLDDKNQERCNRIVEASKHGREIVRNVLAYCRKEQKTLTAMDMVEAYNQFVSLIAYVMPPTIRVDSHCHPSHAMVLGDMGQITQVLINLSNNARDAMDGRGTLTLSLDIRQGDQFEPIRQQRERRPMKPGEGVSDDGNSPFANLDKNRHYVDVRVQDSGCGMSPEVAARIFDPFFTTKPVGQGTGLGLSVVQGIVNSMGGTIGVDSAPGLGTTFRVAIPLIDDTP